MMLQAGARVGPYEIVGPLGAGGMGEVYRARDTRLDRTVAIKVLSPLLAADPIFRERFEREARTISSLDHPNICVLYDVGREGTVDYLVMQFLDGETLADRLARGPLPAGQALEYAAQMAAALDRAHRAGIVHRDLKPGNVMLARAAGSSSAAVKLLDFGLAKAPIVAPADATAVATMTRPLTGQGMIVGTLQYMAPEQVEGRDVDARTDVFALGAIVYEMLTARRAFEAASQAGVMAAILEKDPPPVSAVQPLAPGGLDRIVQRCLAKDPDARWQSASDLAAALAWVRSDSGVQTPPARRPARSRAPLLTAVALAVAAMFAGAWWTFGRTRERPQTIHVTVPTPSMHEPVPEISPDGRMIVWAEAVGDPHVTPLWLQPLDSDAGRAIPGTEGAIFAFWSPDSRHIAFFADRKLKRVAVSGGAPITICEVPDSEARGGSWNADDVIIFSGARIGALSRVAASGGTPQPLTTLDKASGHTTHRWPHFLPDGRHFLYFASRNVGTDPSDSIVFASLDGKDSHSVVHATSNPVFADGRLLYSDKGRLLSQRFDLSAGTVSGDPVPVLDHVRVGYGVTRGLFAAVGPMLVATADDVDTRGYDLRWIVRAGSNPPAAPDATGFNSGAWLSPDGRRMVVSIDDEHTGSSDVWTIDAASGARTRLTFGPASHFSPVWSPDGSKVFYTADRPDGVSLFAKAATGGEEVLFSHALPLDAGLNDCASAYCLIGAWRPEAGTNYDLLTVRLSDGAVQPFAATEADENDARISPDGRFVAYDVAQAGQSEIFVRPFPAGSGLWQISAGGGSAPSWSPDGRTLYFLTAKDVVGVPISNAGGFSPGTPRVVMPRMVGSPAAPQQIAYAMAAPDGRILAAISRAAAASAPYRLVINWNR
jgi:eukaryotic-like serine/threonine-protein kinase